MVLPRILSKKWSKQLIALGFGLVVAAQAHVARAACGDTVDAPGKVFYVVPDGDLVSREVTLTVPACGQGSVVLSSAGGWRAESNEFFTIEKFGQKIFVVVFQNPVGDNPNHYLVLKGSYIRGKNAAKYWGDMYKLNLPEGVLNQDQGAKQFIDENILTHYGRHAGGFGFKAVVPQGEPQPEPQPNSPAPQAPQGAKTFID